MQKKDNVRKIQTTTVQRAKIDLKKKPSIGDKASAMATATTLREKKQTDVDDAMEMGLTDEHQEEFQSTQTLPQGRIIGHN